MVSISAFTADVTPPVGAYVCLRTPAKTIRDPLLARGILLDDGAARVVVVALDYCVLVHAAYEDLRAALARAAGARPDRVVIHCVHQHDAPFLNVEALKYLRIPETFGWWPAIVKTCAAAAGAAAGTWKPVAAVGSAATRVNGYASNRRIAMPNGRVAVRLSRCADETLRNAPVGAIDPWLRTVAFRGRDGDILASLSFYATHPQVANTRDKFSADAPGEAMRLLGGRPGTNLFFTGCGGNVAAGKYSTPDVEANLRHFGKKLADAIAGNLDAMRWEDPGRLDWRSAAFEFPRRPLDRRALLNRLAVNPEDTAAAALLAVMDRGGDLPYVLSRLNIGTTSIFFLPGELFVEYQLFLQSLHPDGSVAVAANCRDDFYYCPLAADLETTGGYETDSFCYAGREFEARFKAAARDMVAGNPSGASGHGAPGNPCAASESAGRAGHGDGSEGRRTP